MLFILILCNLACILPLWQAVCWSGQHCLVCGSCAHLFPSKGLNIMLIMCPVGVFTQQKSASDTSQCLSLFQESWSLNSPPPSAPLSVDHPHVKRWTVTACSCACNWRAQIKHAQTDRLSELATWNISNVQFSRTYCKVWKETSRQGPFTGEMNTNCPPGSTGIELIWQRLDISCLGGEVAQSCPTLCDPVDYSPPGSSIHGVF